MRYLTGDRPTTHEKNEKKNHVSLFAGFWLMTEWNAMNAVPLRNFMQTGLKLHFFLLLAVLSVPALAQAQGTAFTYQGRLNENGSPATGIYDLRFTIYDLNNGGSALAGPIANATVSVSNGLFTSALDFGASVFTGAPRWLEIGVRTNGSVAAHFTLTPRQALTPSPYAIYASTASNVVNGSVVKSLNNLKDNVTLAAGANVTITPNGNTLTLASAGGSSLWNLNGADTYYNAGNVGIGTTTPTAGYRLEVNGATLVRPGNGSIQFGSPNAELGVSLVPTLGNNRADLRFDGSVLKLVAGVGQVPPSSANGLAITTAGNIGIGTATPAAGYRLEVDGTTLLRPGNGTMQFGSPNAELGMSITPTVGSRADLRFDGSVLKLVATAGQAPPSAANGLAITTAGNVGIGTAAPVAKLHTETGLANTAAVYGNATGAGGVGVYGQSAAGAAVHAQGNAVQARDKGGFVKAMAYIDRFQNVVRCFNSQQAGDASSTSPCGITVTRNTVGTYTIDFGFNVEDRFFSVTANAYQATATADVQGPNEVYVTIYAHRIMEFLDTGFYIFVF
jgi:hypothetical protein